MNTQFDECCYEKCRFKGQHKILYKSNNNLYELEHWELVCPKCGAHFNHWNVPKKKLKDIYKEHYQIYK